MALKRELINHESCVQTMRGEEVQNENDFSFFASLESVESFHAELEPLDDPLGKIQVAKGAVRIVPKDIEDEEELLKMRESESEDSLPVLGSIENMQGELHLEEEKPKGRLISD